MPDYSISNQVDITGFFTDVNKKVNEQLAITNPLANTYIGLLQTQLGEVTSAVTDTKLTEIEVPSESITYVPGSLKNASFTGAATITEPETFTGTAPTDTITDTAQTLNTTAVSFPSGLFEDSYTSIHIPTNSIVFSGVTVPDSPTEPNNLEAYIPDPLVLSEISIPTIPNIDLNVSFEGTRPVFSDDITVPEFNYTEPEYTSEIFGYLKDWIIYNVVYGGTGLAADVEALLWERYKSRNITANERVYREAETYFAARGFALPPGALAARIFEAGVEIARAETLASGEIAIKQAELAQANTQFALKYASEIEQILRTYATGLTQRMLEAAKSVTEATVQAGKLLIEKHSMLVETYKTDAVVFEQKIRGEIAKLEAFKIELEGKKVEAEVQQVLSEVYKNAMMGANILIELYKTRVAAAAGKADIEKLKIEELNAKISNYNATIQGELAKATVGELGIKRDSGKIQLASEKIRYMLAEIEETKAKSQLRSENVARQKDMIAVKIEEHNATIAAYKAQLDGYNANIDALVKKYSADVDKYKADIESDKATEDNTIKIYQVEAEHARANAEVRMKAIELQARVAIAEAERGLNAALEEAKLMAQIVSSALTAVHVGMTEGASVSASEDFQGIVTIAQEP